ncbi:DUF368 domain-containing protein [Paenibacillus sp. 32O-W]|uniref:DUF368 domain-containing protein n=1 Tax=Paenibacillus sp. 32O-W TaxID=1695218 RepID=UPI0011A0362B|nr:MULTISPECIES: DUF368 domain-containing protein [Paenibacillaceae]
MEWKNIYRGLLMGISDLIPGVSGGTIAVVLGIYDRLLEAISGFFSRDWKRHIGFLIPLAAGMGTALLLLSRLIKYLLEHHYQPTQFFFIGLIIGVLPFIFRQSEAKRHFKLRHVIVLILAAALLASMAFIQTDKSAEPITNLTLLTVAGLFFSGWLASMAMLLPGISGSFILLVLGVYSTAIHALSELNLPLIAIIGSGVIVGFIVSSKGIRYLLSEFPHMTYAVIIGLILGSIVVVFPGFTSDMATLGISAITLVAGLVVALLFGSKTRA